MTEHPSVHGPRWDRDEAYRQSVIRKALLLGFSAEDYSDPDYLQSKWWSFIFEGHRRTGYASLYSAAYDFLRLNHLEYLAGDYRG
jgi:hypothetical protein